MLVVYTQKNGFKQVREVPASLTNEKEYERGILVGPPDLSDLGFSVAQTKGLNNLLVDAGLVTFADLQRNRDQLMEVIRQTVGVKDKELMVKILIIYQDYYGG